MLRWENQYILYALFLIPLLAGVFWLYLIWKKKAINKFAESGLANRLMPEVSKARPLVKFIFLMLAFASLIIALANPQVGSKLEKSKRQGIDLILCLDISNSMLALDIKPNRLERAKFAISKLIDKLEEDRIGIVVFAGEAFIQLPITSDQAAAKMFISNISTELIPLQGTAIGAAIDKARGSFKKDNLRNKAIIVISDGENHEDDAVGAAAKAVAEGIIVYTIGIGTPEGGPIPLQESYNQYLKDNNGNIVITRLDENIMQQIAATGKGIYVRTSLAETGFNTIIDEIKKIEKREYESKIITEYEDRFQYFIGLAMIFLIIEILLFERRNVLLSKFNPFKSGFMVSEKK